jgi:2-oxoglutarate ferredoxin oxidoreductase subunit alpha
VWPFPAALREILGRYERILIPEMNLGQLWRLVRSEYAMPAYSFTKVQGRPFTTREMLRRIQEVLKGPAAGSSHPIESAAATDTKAAFDESGG